MLKTGEWIAPRAHTANGQRYARYDARRCPSGAVHILYNYSSVFSPDTPTSATVLYSNIGEQGKGCWGSYYYGNNVVSLQINTAGIMAMNRVDRDVLDPIRTYACTRTARTGVRVTESL